MTGPEGLRVRPATADDLAPLLALELDAFGADAWSEAVLAEALAGGEAGPARRTVVAGDVEVLGYAVSRVAGDVVDLERIVVRRDARRRGVAGALLTDLLDHAGGADRMLLEVSAANSAAVAFYARHGFTQIDVRPRYYRDGSDALVLRRALVAGCGGNATRSAARGAVS